MRLMPVTDAMFLWGESREMPMHIGGINLYTLPEGVDETEWLNEQLALLRQSEGLRRPFSEVLKLTPFGQYGPIRLEPDRDIDMHYHVRAAALPKPGRYREMFELASRLHSGLLDRTRPLWEITLISGLPNRQIATFKKVHHSLMDGAASIHFYNSMLSADPKERRAASPLSVEAYEAYKRQFPAPKKPPRPNLIDIKAIGDLRGLDRTEDGAVRIGALTTHRELERSDVIAGELPGLAALEARVANVRVRNTGTIGGNLDAVNGPDRVSHGRAAGLKRREVMRADEQRRRPAHRVEVAHLRHVSDRMAVVQRHEHVGLRLERVDLRRGDPGAGDALAEATDLGWIDIERDDLVPGPRHGLVQDAAGGDRAVAGGSADRDLDVRVAHPRCT